jgi:hypothetical protein
MWRNLPVKFRPGLELGTVRALPVDCGSAQANGAKAVNRSSSVNASPEGMFEEKSMFTELLWRAGPGNVGMDYDAMMRGR